jgi:hypothetical protein
MSEELIKYVNMYIHQVISGFESGIYKMILHNHPDKLKYLASNYQPFIPIFRDLHESYYTSTFNSIVKRDDKYVVETFDKLQELSKHSKQCLLNILANLIVSIHFNMDRKKLQYTNQKAYLKSLQKAINEIISVVNMPKLFDHECKGASDAELKIIPEGEKFITIKMSFKSNGVEKEIRSFIDHPDEHDVSDK